MGLKAVAPMRPLVAIVGATGTGKSDVCDGNAWWKSSYGYVLIADVASC